MVCCRWHVADGREAEAGGKTGGARGEPGGEAILDAGIGYGTMRRHGASAQDHDRGAAGASGEGTTS